MSDQLNRIVKLCVDLIITASLIGIVASFAFVSYKGYGERLQHIASKKLIERKLELYDYDNKIVNGYDIVDAIITNVRLYRFDIITKNGSYRISADNEYDKYGSKSGLKVWSANYIREEVLGDNIFSNFNSTLIRHDGDKDIIIGIRFEQEGA